MDEPRWVLPAAVEAIHRRQLAEHGGGDGVRDPGLLESALNRALNRWAYSSPPPSLGELAAVYAHGIATNHPFVDGNKRTALIVMLLFLRLNGCRLEASDEEKYLAILRIAEGSLGEEGLIEWVCQRVRST